jgi:uncharacterized protein YbbK (DUF523 family)
MAYPATPAAVTSLGQLIVQRAPAATVGEALHACGLRRPLSLLVSACLLGRPVNYRGAAARMREGHVVPYLAEVARAVPTGLRLVPFCPELALGSPRPPIRLVGARQRVLTRDGEDVTETLAEYAHRHVRFDTGRVRALQSDGEWLDVHGFIGKSKSPSCAALTARVYETVDCRDKYANHPGAFVAYLHAGVSQDLWHFPITADVPLQRMDREQLSQFFDKAIQRATNAG